jgi:hypothetical protein
MSTLEERRAAFAAEFPDAKHNPYDSSTWGHGCARGIAYKDVGAPVASGTKGVVRKITAGRKHRGMSSDSPSVR